MFKKVEESMSILKRNRESIKKIQIKLLEMKNIKSKMKNTLDTVNSI